MDVFSGKWKLLRQALFVLISARASHSERLSDPATQKLKLTQRLSLIEIARRDWLNFTMSGLGLFHIGFRERVSAVHLLALAH